MMDSALSTSDLPALHGQVDLQLLLGLDKLLGVRHRRCGGRRPAEPAVTIFSSAWAWPSAEHRGPASSCSWKTRSNIRCTSATSTGSSPTVAATPDFMAGSGCAKAGAAIERKANNQTNPESLFHEPVLCDAGSATEKTQRAPKIV